MTSQPYELRWSKSARRAIAERLPEAVAVSAVELITGPLAAAPRRLGKPLREELTGIHGARLGREWRILYEINESRRELTILDIRHRSVAYRSR